jgi:hypothetical protein
VGFTKDLGVVVKPMTAFVNPRAGPNRGGSRPNPATISFPIVVPGLPTALPTTKVLLQQHLASGFCAHDVRLITL